VSVAEVRLVCKHFADHPGAWRPGLLYKIICGMRGGQKVTWPDPSPEYDEAQKRQARAASRQSTEDQTLQIRRQRKEADAQRERDKAAYEALDRRLGPKLDAMPKARLREFAKEHCPLLASGVPDRGPVTSPMLRSAMLLKLEQIEAESHA